MSAFFKLTESQVKELNLHPDHKINFVPIGHFVFPVSNINIYSGDEWLDYYVGKNRKQVQSMLKRNETVYNGFSVNN